MDKIQGKHVILNGIKIQAEKYSPQHSSPVLYEVMRIIDHKVIFLMDHIDRLVRSCNSSGINMEINRINKNLEVFLSSSEIEAGNVMINVFENKQQLNIATFQIPHVYPSEKEYINGVITKSFSFSRPTPTIKKWNENFRNQVNNFIQNNHIYEALLLNENREFTEGSKSNLFFINEDNNIHTAPESIVLPGITRKYIFQICKENNIKIFEKLVKYDELQGLKSCFITGTSPMVLPINQIDDFRFDVEDQLLKLLMEQYKILVRTHLS